MNTCLLMKKEKMESGDTSARQVNDKVLVWLFGSMEPIVRQQVEIMTTVLEVWSALEKQFSGKSNKMQATRIMGGAHSPEARHTIYN
jgi:hypothetical protein